jgi:hypothetical protein
MALNSYDLGSLACLRNSVFFMNTLVHGSIHKCLPLDHILTHLEVEVEVTLRLTVSQYVMVSSTLVGLAIRYFFLSKCCCLKYPDPSRSRSYFTTDNRSVCHGIEHPCRTCDQILLPVGMLLSEICGHVSVGRPLWREDGSAICSVITQWSESLRTRSHALLSNLRLSQPGGPGSHIYIPQEQGGPVIPI